MLKKEDKNVKAAEENTKKEISEEKLEKVVGGRPKGVQPGRHIQW